MSEELFTVKEIADLLEVSKPTVQRAIHSANIEADKEDNKHSRFYSYEKALQIIRAINSKFDVSNLAKRTATPQQSGETPQNEAPNEAQHTATPQQTGELELVKSMLATIQAQLEVKDKQIAAFEEQLAIKDKQIEDYSARLAEAMQLTKGQQFIAAADKVERLNGVVLDPDGEQDPKTVDPTETRSAAVVENAEPEQQTEEKKSFWKRLFGK